MPVVEPRAKRFAIVFGDRPKFWMAATLSLGPCVWLIAAGLMLLLSSLGMPMPIGGATSKDAAFLIAFGGVGMAILVPFLLRLCCLVRDGHLITFVTFRPSSIAIDSVATIAAEPFGTGSRVIARLDDDEIRVLFMTGCPWWSSYELHQQRVGRAVEHLQSAIRSRS